MRRQILVALAVIFTVLAAYEHWFAADPSLSKSVEEYWADTGLRPDALEDLVDDDLCRSSQRYFLACVNAVGAVAERLGLQLTTEGRLLRSTSLPDSTERELLEPWKSFFADHPGAAARISFRKTWRQLVNDHVTADRRAFVTGSALNGFLSVFRDPHTYVLPVAYFQNVLSKSNSISSALGVVLARAREDYFLRKVVEGSPSAKAGLRRGDWVIAVNGIRLRSVPPQRLSELLKADGNESTVLEIRRDERVFTVEVPRGRAEIPSVTWRRLDGVRPVGLLTINKFSRQSCREVRDALVAMNEARLRGLLLDVRDNSGGQMDEAACMVGLFIGAEKEAFRIRYLDPAKDPEVYYGSEPQIWTGKVAVLVNSGTASASEILAGSLRDHHRAILVGERTFGKGSFQEGELWTRNRKIAFFQTKGFYYLPSGYSPQLRGIEPDVKIDFRATASFRESDQFINPLNPPTVRDAQSRALDLSSCLDADDGTGSLAEDPQMSGAKTALFCGVAAGGSRAEF